MKPLFRDMDVYVERQDRERSLFRELYEGVIGGVARLLQNTPRDEVAAKTSGGGRIESPQTSTAETIVRLIQSAFSQAILPGFHRQLDRIRRA